MNEEPLILTVAPNGAYKSTSDHAALPITPEALAATARACLDAGAAMLHLHVRHPDGRHSLRADHYREAQAAVRAAVGQELVIQVTTEAAGVYEPAEQVAVVYELQPEAVSVSLRELLRPGLSESDFSAFFRWLLATQTMTQVILYDAAEVAQWNQLRARGVIPEGPWFLLFVLGRYTAGQTSSATDLLPFLQTWDGTHPWAMCAFGAQEHLCATAALALGGHVRVGFENNLWRRDGHLAPDNASLVRQVAESAALAGRPLASAAQVRARFRGN
jgi:uncharacterized protein (DUF849 family)